MAETNFDAIRNSFGVLSDEEMPLVPAPQKDDIKTVNQLGEGIDPKTPEPPLPGDPDYVPPTEEEEDEDDQENEDRQDVYSEDQQQEDEDDDPIIRINKVEYRKSELLQEMAEHFKVDLETLGEDSQVALLESYINNRHYESGKKSIDKKHNEIAEKKRELAQAEEELTVRKEELSQQEKTIAEQNSILAKQEQMIAAKLEKLNNAKAGIQKVMEEDPDMLDDEREAIALRVKQDLMKNGEGQIDEELKYYKEQAEAIKKQISSNDEQLNNMYMEGLYKQLIDQVPDLKTSKHFVTILESIEQTGRVDDIEEATLAEFIGDVLTSYVKSNSKLSIADFYEVKFSWKNPRGKEVVPKRKQKSSDLTGLTAKEMALKILQKQKTSPGTPESLVPTMTPGKKGADQIADYNAVKQIWKIPQS